jgi:4-carboxymuconolactone decarboxylase
MVNRTRGNRHSIERYDTGSAQGTKPPEFARGLLYPEQAMLMRLILLLLASALFAPSQSPRLPADVDSASYSRLPLLTREKMTPEQVQVMDKIAKDRPAPQMGPQATSIYSPGVAEPVDALNQYLRKTVVGQHYFEICAMIGAWEMENAYEFSAHEVGARRAGVEDNVIDAIKFDRNLKGLPEKDAAVIEFGRALFRGHHHASPALYAKVVGMFGRQGMIELVSVMGDYSMMAIVLNAAGQELPPERKNTLPAR